MKRFGIARLPTVQSLVEEVGLCTPDSFRSLDALAMKTVLRSLRDNVDPSLPARARVDCSLPTIAALEVMAFAINTLVDRGVEPDEDLLAFLDTEAVGFFKEVVRHMRNKTCSMSETLVLPPLAKGTPVNSTGFSQWVDSVQEELDTKTSADGFTPLSYVTRPEEEEKAYCDLDEDRTLRERAKVSTRLAG